MLVMSNKLHFCVVIYNLVSYYLSLSDSASLFYCMYWVTACVGLWCLSSVLLTSWCGHWHMHFHVRIVSRSSSSSSSSSTNNIMVCYKWSCFSLRFSLQLFFKHPGCFYPNGLYSIDGFCILFVFILCTYSAVQLTPRSTVFLRRQQLLS
jgi:hypothetical protein